MNAHQLNSLNDNEICAADKMQDVSSNTCTQHPWSLLGISKIDIDSVLNDDLFDQNKNKDDNASTNKARSASQSKKSSNASKKKKPIVRSSAKLNFKSKRKLPLTVRQTASTPPLVKTLQIHRKSSICSTKSIDTEHCDTSSLPSITSSSSFLNDMNNPKSTIDRKSLDTSDTEYASEFTKVKSEISVTQASLQDGIPVPGDEIRNNSSEYHKYSNGSPIDTPRQPTLTATSSGVTIHQSNVHPQEVYEQQQESYCQQSSFIPYDHHNNNSYSSIHGNLIELQLQYQRSIQRITNSMRQSYQTTRYIVQLQQQVQQRRRSSIFAPPQQQQPQQQQHHQYRRRSSLFCQMTDKTIHIPITEISESTRHVENNGVLEVKATNNSDTDIGNDNTVVLSRVISSTHNKNDTNSNVNNENDNDELSTTSSCNTSVTSNVVFNQNNNDPNQYHYHRRRSSINFTNMNRKFSLTHQPSRRTSSLSMYSNNNNNVNSNTNNNTQMMNQNLLPSHQQQLHHQHQHQQLQHSPFIISTNVEQSRQILYHILHSTNHMNDFMMM
jgi:hypothetical protein